MAIRITGMYSGLDTESIINELASAQSYKKNKLVKAQTKLSWKQDAWKALNTKIYSFYQKLDDMRLQSSYLKKKTTVSNPNAVQVSGGNLDGNHTVSVEQLSKRAYLTGGSLAKGNVGYSANATLAQLGLTQDGSIRFADANGVYVDVDVKKDMKISDFVNAVNGKTALTASFDQDNQRIHISSWESGKNADFTVTGNDAGGMEALKALKLLSASDIDKLTAAGGEYDVWSKYRNADGTPTADYLALIKKETEARLKAMKEQNETLAQENTDYDKANQKNRADLKEFKANAGGKYDAYKDYLTNYSDSWTAQDMKTEGERLYNEIYGTETTQQAKNEDGSDKFDDDNNPVMETVRVGGMAGKLADLQKTLDEKKEDLKNAREALEANSGDAGLMQAVKDAETAVADASKDVSSQQNKIKMAAEVYSYYNAFNYNEDQKKANQDQIDKNNAKFAYDENTKTYKEKDAGGNEVEIGQGVVAAEVTTQFDKKVEVAKDVMKNTATWKNDAEGTKIDGEDSDVVVDGVHYHSGTDTVTVNGMEITALEKTDGKEVNITTKTDTDGVYDMIKDFIKAYSELVNEMDSLYNAESSKGYEPLLSEEKDALSDTEIEEWEKKIKDSLLRRDSTLSDVSSSIRMSMMFTMQIGGKTYSLASFGIETQSYFKAKDNERNAYHILGDKDDPLSWNPEDGDPDLRSMIEKEPEAVMEFFVGLTNNLHDTLAEKMSGNKMSSAFTVYNDKKMKEDYDDYTDKIKKQEEKLNAYIDKWYAKFSAMETALAKLESKNNSLSSLFGG